MKINNVKDMVDSGILTIIIKIKNYILSVFALISPLLSPHTNKVLYSYSDYNNKL